MSCSRNSLNRVIRDNGKEHGNYCSGFRVYSSYSLSSLKGFLGDYMGVVRGGPGVQTIAQMARVFARVWDLRFRVQV